MEQRLTREHWIKGARTALLSGGVGAVSVEKLAKQLGVTKGSFYWHFADRAELLEALLAEWESETDLLTEAVAAGQAGLRQLADELAQNVILSEKGETPSDAAIFGWAAVSPEVAERVSVAEEKRIALFAALLGSRERAEFLYMAYLGFILRRRRAENATALFRLIMDFAVDESASLAGAGERNA
jgi:AcrR family transcriptional regulator